MMVNQRQYSIFTSFLVIVFRRTNIDYDKKKHSALDCLIDITTAMKCAKRGQTIYISKFALFNLFFSLLFPHILLILLFGHAFSTYSVLSIADPLSNWEITHRNYTISVHSHNAPHHHRYYADNRALWYVTIHWKVVIFHLNAGFSTATFMHTR